MEFSRRSFLEVIVGGSALLFVPESFAQTMPGAPVQSTESDVRVIPVVQNMTANTAMGFIARESGIDLGQKISDDSRKYLSVQLGKSPKVVHVGSNAPIVTLSDQLAWKTKKSDVADFAYKMQVERNDKTIDYLFPGDKLILDLGKMNPADREKVVKRFGEQAIQISRNELKGYVSNAHAAQIERARNSIKAMDIDNERKARYLNMEPDEFLARLIEPGLKDVMYKPLAEQGLKFESPTQYVQRKVAEGVSGPEHRARDPKLAQFYLGFSFMRPNETTPRSIGIVPPDPGAHYDLQLRLEQDEIRKLLGEKDYALIEAKTQQERRLVRGGAHDVAYVAFVRSIFDTLAAKAETIDTRTGNVTNAIKASTYFQDHPGYTFRAVVVQKVVQN